MIRNTLMNSLSQNCNWSQPSQRSRFLSRKNKSITVGVSRLLFYVQIKLCKLFDPPFFQCPQLRHLQTTHRVVISIYSTFITAQQILSIFFSHFPFQYRKFQLYWTIIQHIMFRWPQPSSCKCDWSIFTLMLLWQNNTQTLITCIYLQNSWHIEISICKHMGTGQSQIQGQ